MICFLSESMFPRELLFTFPFITYRTISRATTMSGQVQLVCYEIDFHSMSL